MTPVKIVSTTGLRFEARYDREADVLYLRRAGWRGPAVRVHATKAGHAVRRNENGDIIGLTVVNARRTIEEHQSLGTPEPVDSGDLAPALL